MADHVHMLLSISPKRLCRHFLRNLKWIRPMSGAKNWRHSLPSAARVRPASAPFPSFAALRTPTGATTNDLTPCRMPLVLSAPPLALRLRQNKRPYGYAGVVVHRSSAAAPSTSMYSFSVKYPVASLPHGGQRIANLLAEGYVDVRDVPTARLASPRHQRIQRVALSETAEMDPVVGETLRHLSYPRYYLDFESIQFAVPIWAGTRPYQQLVFQWSCHIERESGKLEHADYLGDSGQDPRRAFAERLIDTLGEHGSVFVYNQGFEGGCLRQLAEAFPDLATPLQAIRERLVDLLPLARNHYYHPDMQGSWSIKAVLPTVAPDLAYEALAVQHGGMAQQAYLQLIEPGITPERRDELRQGLLAYCSLDTLALVRLAWYFEGRSPVSPS